MATGIRSRFDFEPPAPSLLETVTALKQNPGDNDLFSVACWMAGEYGACTLTTQELARMAGITPAAAANSRYRLIQSGFLYGKFITEGLPRSVWSLTVPNKFNFNILSDTDVLAARFAMIEQKLASGRWVVDGKSGKTNKTSVKSAIEIWDSILEGFRVPWFGKWHRILSEGIIPLGVRWNILFTKIVTDECYHWLESSRHRSLDATLHKVTANAVRFIDYGLGEMPVGILTAHTILRSKSNPLRWPTVNDRPICGFCGCESQYQHSHIPFRVFDLIGGYPGRCN